MTIVIGIATPEGLVLASDSRTTTLGGPAVHRIASDNMQKVFTVGEMGIATFGDAFIGTDTIAGVMDQFTAQCPAEDKKEIRRFAGALGRFFDARFREHKDPPPPGEFSLGFLVAGYDDAGVGRVIEVAIPGPEVVDPDLVTTNGGIIWRGQTAVIRRMIKGVDLDALDELKVDISDSSRAQLEGLQYNLSYPITVQDAIDCAAFLVRTTVDMERFADGILAAPGGLPACGGRLQLLAIERSRHSWVERLDLLGPSEPGIAEGEEG